MKLYYYLYRKLKHIPCREEIRDVIKSEVYLSPAIAKVAYEYSLGSASTLGYDLGTIAKGNNITRERARKYLFKAIRIANYRKNSFICFAYSINDVNGQPKGFIWLTACFMDSNFRLFPIGYRK